MNDLSHSRHFPGAGKLEKSVWSNKKGAKKSSQLQLPVEVQEDEKQAHSWRERGVCCCGTSSGCAMRRLLLISCSATKKHDDHLLPAIKRYDGGIYRVVRAHRCQRICVWIISAEFGLISERRLIPDYERRMVPSRAKQLEPIVSTRLDRVLRSGRFSSVFVNLGEAYGQTVSTSLFLSQMRSTGLVCEAYGGIGQRLRQTKQWLLACKKDESVQRKGSTVIPCPHQQLALPFCLQP